MITTFPSGINVFTVVNDPFLFTSGVHTHPIILLINAMLSERRIIFIGHGKPSGEVSNYVLATCAMGSGFGVLRGFSERAFPYSNLINVDELLDT